MLNFEEKRKEFERRELVLNVAERMYNDLKSCTNSAFLRIAENENGEWLEDENGAYIYELYDKEYSERYYQEGLIALEILEKIEKMIEKMI